MSVAAPALTVRGALQDATARLAGAGVPSPRVDAEWLLAGILGIGRASLGIALDRLLSPDSAAAYARAVECRATREPLQQILGWEDFRGLRLRVTPDVLIPRPETETLVEWTLELLPPPAADRLRVVDVGTGSGCIACALVAARADVDVIAVDVSEAAARVADANVRGTSVAASADSERRGVARVVIGDLASPVRTGSIDAIVANAPYLSDAQVAALEPEVAAHEPALALSGGMNGLDVLARLIEEALRVLRAGGLVLLETSGAEQVAVIGTRLDTLGFEHVAARADLAGITRFVAARAPRMR